MEAEFLHLFLLQHLGFLELSELAASRSLASRLEGEAAA